MDLLPPKPTEVVSAAGNLAHLVRHGGVADLRPMPRTLIDQGPLRAVYHYRPSPAVIERGDPVLLVSPLAAPAICYDLRRGCSLVEHLVAMGRPTYLVEYGEVPLRDRRLGVERWVDEVVPAALEAVCSHAGGRPVHLVGWGLGGIFAMLTAADRGERPIASLTLVGSPVDVGLVPMVAPPRPLLRVDDGAVLTRAYRLIGGAPVVRWVLQTPSVQKIVTKPLAVLTNLDDADYLAQLEAVDRFKGGMVAYPGRSFGQLYHRFVKSDRLPEGAFDVGGRTTSLADIQVPVLVLAGANDGIAPVAAVRAVIPHLTGSPSVRFEIVPGGHLGMLTGRAARRTTWSVMDEWIDQ